MDSLKHFLLDEATFRLKRIFKLPEKSISVSLVFQIMDELYKNANLILNYAVIDAIIDKVLKQNEIDY